MKFGQLFGPILMDYLAHKLNQRLRLNAQMVTNGFYIESQRFN